MNTIKHFCSLLGLTTLAFVSFTHQVNAIVLRLNNITFHDNSPTINGQFTLVNGVISNLVDIETGPSGLPIGGVITGTQTYTSGTLNPARTQITFSGTSTVTGAKSATLVILLSDNNTFTQFENGSITSAAVITPDYPYRNPSNETVGTSSASYIRGITGGTIEAVPFESDVLPLLGATVLFAGGLWWKRRRGNGAVSFESDES